MTRKAQASYTINRHGMITPTRHEKLEWSRMAQAAYHLGRNDVGHRYSGLACIRDDQSLFIETFDQAQASYRTWLIDHQFPIL